MTRFRFFIAVICAALVAGACRGGSKSDPIPAGLPGTYVYGAKGSTFGKKWDFAVRLVLTPDRRYELTLDKMIDGGRDSTETRVGTYAVSGDHLLLPHAHDQRDASKNWHKLLIRPDSLIAEVGWTAEIFLKGVGAPNIVFVKERRG